MNEFEDLQFENQQLRDGIESLIVDLEEDAKTELWLLINGLVENEINQEESCNK